jgi:hypothetical protein
MRWSRWCTDVGYHLPLRFGLCVSADAAAVLAACEDFGLASTFPAAEAAFLDVTSLLDAISFFTSFARPQHCGRKLSFSGFYSRFIVSRRTIADINNRIRINIIISRTKQSGNRIIYSSWQRFHFAHVDNTPQPFISVEESANLLVSVSPRQKK